MTTSVVLLVTAEQGFAAHATRALTQRGYVVLIARTVQDAREAVIRLAPDVMLLDSRGTGAALEGRDGQDLLQHAERTRTRCFVMATFAADVPTTTGAAPWSRLEWNPAVADLGGALAAALADEGRPSILRRGAAAPEATPRS